MRAVVLFGHGDPDVLVAAEIAAPLPGAGEVRVRVRACALNRLDLFVRKGWPGLVLPMPHVLGSDIAGVVESVGDGVGSCSPNDPVVVAPGIGCGRCAVCAAGEDNRCSSYRLLGENLHGGYAELVTVPKENVFPKPKNLSFEEAACMPLVFTTAWGMLVERGRLCAQETVLIHAAGSGVGSAAIQIAKLLGATVITTAGTEAKLAKAEALGADHRINYQKESFFERVKEITKKRGVDLVIEHTGGETFNDSIRCLSTGGRLVTCGASGKPQVEIDIRQLFMRHRTIIGNTMGSRNALIPILEHAERGDLVPVLDRVLSLAEAPTAHRLLEDRAQFGKIVLSI